MTFSRIKDLLEKNHIEYDHITHAPAFTSQETAQTSHVKGKYFAKPVMLRVNEKLVMAVLPATKQINIDRVKKELHASKVRLADEEEFRYIFSDCEIGAMPPMGNLYGLEVYVAPELTEDEGIIFNAGTHTEVIGISYKDYDKLVHPTVLPMSMN